MEKEETLKNIGLTETESRIYLMLLKLGEAAASEIVKRTGFYKPTVYAVLEKLERKGIVTHIIKEYKKLYSPVTPKRLLSVLEERKEDLVSLLPSLLKDYESVKSEKEINVMLGIEGLKTMYNEILSLNKDYDGIGPLKSFSVLQYRFIQYLKKFAKTDIRFRFILIDMPDIKENLSKLSSPFLSIKERWKVRFIPKNYFSPVAVNIYGDTVALIIWEDEPLVISIKNKNVAKTFRNYFNLLWKTAKL